MGGGGGRLGSARRGCVNSVVVAVENIKDGGADTREGICSVVAW